MISFMLDLQQRFAMALSHADTTISKLKSAKGIGMTYQALKKIESGHTKTLDAKNCVTLAKLLNVDIVWLATGAGDMTTKTVTSQPHPDLSEKEQKLIDLWSQIGPIYQARLMEGLELLVEKMSSDADAAISDIAGMVAGKRTPEIQQSKHLGTG